MTELQRLEEVVTAIVRDVAELPNRTSPDYNGDMMIVSASELASIVRGQFIDGDGEFFNPLAVHPT